MGMTAGNKCQQILENTKTILAIELICARQAIELAGLDVPKGLKEFYHQIHKTVPYITNDRLYQNDIVNVKNLLEDTKFQALLKHIS
jgi:histidine ammonia-lyase